MLALLNVEWKIVTLIYVYGRLKAHAVPNVGELRGSDVDDGLALLGPSAVLAPPWKKKYLLMALRDIVEALVAMHSISTTGTGAGAGWGLMHRDVRWANVLKTRSAHRWFLIGFENSVESPAPRASALHLQLGDHDHAPEMVLLDEHDVKVDVRGVGHLIASSSVRLDPTGDMKKLQFACMRHDPSKRPEPQEVLAQVKILLASLCEDDREDEGEEDETVSKYGPSWR